MVSAELRSELVALKERLWDLAKRSLDEDELQIYDSLVEITKRVNNLVPTVQGELAEGHSAGAETPSANSQEIFKRYKGVMYTALLDRTRIVGRTGDCVFYQGKWQTPSAAAAAVTITQPNVNGWQAFWKYRRPDGIVATIDELRGRDKPPLL